MRCMKGTAEASEMSLIRFIRFPVRFVRLIPTNSLDSPNKTIAENLPPSRRMKLNIS